MDDMRAADVDFLTIGQYLQPTPKHHAVDRFVTPDEFAGYEKAACGKGFLMVSATPLTRSSYHAGRTSPACARRGWRSWGRVLAGVSAGRQASVRKSCCRSLLSTSASMRLHGAQFPHVPTG